jgi:hypothetical protein
MIYECEKYLIVLAGLALAVIELRLYFKHIRSAKKILIASVGLYWASYYIWSIIRPLIDADFIAHQIFVRPGILFTVSVILAQAINKWKRVKDA